MRRGVFAVIGALLAIGLGLAIWASPSERGIVEDIGDALVRDAGDAAEFAERYSQERQRPGETLTEVGCGLKTEDTADSECRSSFDSGRGLSFDLVRDDDREYRVANLKEARPNRGIVPSRGSWRQRTRSAR